MKTNRMLKRKEIKRKLSKIHGRLNSGTHTKNKQNKNWAGREGWKLN